MHPTGREKEVSPRRPPTTRQDQTPAKKSPSRPCRETSVDGARLPRTFGIRKASDNRRDRTRTNLLYSDWVPEGQEVIFRTLRCHGGLPGPHQNERKHFG